MAPERVAATGLCETLSWWVSWREVSGRWRPRLRGHGNPRSCRPAKVVSRLQSSHSACQSCHQACQSPVSSVRQPVSSLSQSASLSSPVSLSFLSTILSASLSANLSVPSVGQPVSRSVGQVTRPQFPVGPCAISGLCRRRGRGSAGTRGAGRQDPDLAADAAGLLRAPQPGEWGSLPGFGGFPGATEGVREGGAA